MKEKNRCLDNDEEIYNNLKKNKGFLNFKGWNIKNKEDLIKNKLEEYLEKECNFVKIESCETFSFSCPTYYNGQKSFDEGYTHWIEYLPAEDFKNGLGKNTRIFFSFEMLDDDYY